MDGWHEHKMFTDAHRCASGLICRTLTHPYQTWSTMKNKLSVTRGRTIEGKLWFTASTTIVIGDIVAGEVYERKSQPVVAILVVLANDPKMIQPVIIWPDRRIVRWCVWAGMNWVNQSYWNCGSVKCLFSVTLNRDWDRLRYHRRHTGFGFLTYQNPLFVSDKYWSWYLWIWRSVFDADNSSVELFAHDCQSQLLPLVSTTQAAFASYDGWQDGECPFLRIFKMYPVALFLGRCDNNNRRQKVHDSWWRKGLSKLYKKDHGNLRSQVSPEAPLDSEIVITNH